MKRFSRRNNDSFCNQDFAQRHRTHQLDVTEAHRLVLPDDARRHHPQGCRWSPDQRQARRGIGERVRQARPLRLRQVPRRRGQPRRQGYGHLPRGREDRLKQSYEPRTGKHHASLCGAFLF